MPHCRLPAVILALGLAFGAAACGSSGDDDAATTTEPPTTVADSTTTTVGTFEAPTTEAGRPGDTAVGDFGAEAGITDEGETYEEFVQVSDDSGTLVVEVPTEWSDVDGTATDRGDPSLQAAPDLGGDISTTPVLGYTAVEFTTPPDLDDVITQTADATTGGECEAQDAADYTDGVFSGRVQAFINCGGEDRAWLFVAATPDNGDSYATVIFGQAVTVADVEAIQHAFDTFNTSL